MGHLLLFFLEYWEFYCVSELSACLAHNPGVLFALCENIPTLPCLQGSLVGVTPVPAAPEISRVLLSPGDICLMSVNPLTPWGRGPLTPQYL